MASELFCYQLKHKAQNSKLATKRNVKANEKLENRLLCKYCFGG